MSTMQTHSFCCTINNILHKYSIWSECNISVLSKPKQFGYIESITSESNRYSVKRSSINQSINQSIKLINQSINQPIVIEYSMPYSG